MSKSPQPAWLDHAWASLGVHEVAGPRSASDVLDFYRDAGHPEIRDDDVAWCAAFVGACLERASVNSTRSLRARSYQSWGDAIATPDIGAIAVFSRGADITQGHVGFLIGSTRTHIMLLGGNQSDCVSVEAIPRDRLLALRWPIQTAGHPVTPTTPVAPASIFDVALAHVFEMEGGYTDDPHDPGGPTNLGITLATYATWRNIALSADTFGSLKAELRALDHASAQQIYQQRYWSRCSAEALPPALALMHFDASVNHGLTGAARLLQQACDIDIDGEIGPETLSAARTQPLEPLLDAYADARIQRYRALPHFWRFGRGWLARVAKTRAACSPLLSRSTQQPPKENDMTTSATSPKWWGNSMTVWGTLITALSTVLPVLAPLLGVSITPEIIQQIGDGVIQFVQAAGGLIGTILALYGRSRAVQTLVRKPVSLWL
jgi:uncharacterized protein (TIGR02594 family)